MEKLYVFLERLGTFEKVGELVRHEKKQITFSYCKEYLDKSGARPLSINLPLQEAPFGTQTTEIFFEGLLPEGFLRRQLASSMKTIENDYFSMLKLLGAECLGAVWIFAPDEERSEPDYVEVSKDMIRALAKEGAGESVSLMMQTHLSLTGASGKAGLYYDERSGKWYYPLGTAPSTHIIKQSHVRYKNMVVNEKLCLLTASRLGIDVPESFIVETAGFDDGEILFATKRYDRIFRSEGAEQKEIAGLPAPYRLHQEDFSQALGIRSSDKYEKPGGEYLKKAFDLIRNYAEDPIADSYKLWDYLIFDYLIGNTDNHIKNLSFLYSPDQRSVKLAPLYDTVSTVIYDSSTHDMSMSIDGKYKLEEIKRQSFENITGDLYLGKKRAMEHFDRLKDGFENALNDAASELDAKGFETAFEIKEKILKAREISAIR